MVIGNTVSQLATANCQLTVVNIDVGFYPTANPLIAINVPIQGFPLTPQGIVFVRPHGLFMYIINHKLLLCLKVNDFVYFLGRARNTRNINKDVVAVLLLVSP